MPAPPANQTGRSANRSGPLFGGAVLIWFASALGISTWQGLDEFDSGPAERALTMDDAARTFATLGHPPILVDAIRDSLGKDGRLILFSEVPGDMGEILLRRYRGRLKNYLYPHPPVVRFVRSEAALLELAGDHTDVALLHYPPFGPAVQAPAPGFGLRLDLGAVRLWSRAP